MTDHQIRVDTGFAQLLAKEAKVRGFRSMREYTQHIARIQILPFPEVEGKKGRRRGRPHTAGWYFEV